MIGDRIHEIQEALEEADLDGWLLTCFQRNDPISLELLGLSHLSLITRRCYYLVPRSGEPRKLVHGLEPAMLDGLPGEKKSYVRWQELSAELAALVGDTKRLAAQYSPDNQLPTISRLDAGTAEFLRAQGVNWSRPPIWLNASPRPGPTSSSRGTDGPACTSTPSRRRRSG